MSATFLAGAVAPAPLVSAPRTSAAWAQRTAHVLRRIAQILLVTCAAFAVLGYHPGVEDDGTYLASIKHDLNPALYPHDLPFVAVQLQLTLFDKLIAATVRVTHLPLAWVEMLWQFAGLFIFFASLWSIATLCFREAEARWGGLCFVALMLAMPISMTDLFLVDQHLHPRLLATDCILLAVLALLRGRAWLVLPLLAAGAVLHPLMTAFGVSFCLFLAVELRWPGWWLHGLSQIRAAVMPASWLWEKPTADWERATGPRRFLYLYKWPWYGWVTILAPLALLGWLRHIALRRGEQTQARLCSALMAYGIFQLGVAMVLLAPQAPPWFLQFEPMRFLHIVYVFAALLGAGAFARFWLRRHVLRWVLVFLPLAALMYADQQNEFAGSPHIEWPGARPANPWLQAFAWIRQNTPTSAYFAVNPWYADAPGEGVHGFRALAERSVLVDEVKDPGIVTHVPDLAPRWVRESAAEQGWEHFGAADFERLHHEFGVNWLLTARPQPTMMCPYHNASLWVCRL